MSHLLFFSNNWSVALYQLASRRWTVVGLYMVWEMHLLPLVSGTGWLWTSAILFLFMCVCVCVLCFRAVIQHREHRTSEIPGFFKTQLCLLWVETRKWSIVFYMISKIHTHEKRITSEHTITCYRFSDISAWPLPLTSSLFLLFNIGSFQLVEFSNILTL